MTLASVVPAGLVAGTWSIETAHSEVSFTVKHLGLFKVRGSFTAFEGQITVTDAIESSTVAVEVDMTSVDTRDADRDTHLKSADFFDVDKYPAMKFRSTGLRFENSGAVLVGELTIRDTTRPLELAVEAAGVLQDPMGMTRTGFSARGELVRSDYGITFNMPLGDSRVMLSDKVQIQLDIQAVLQTDATS
ncbi:YceI family protein [Streptomyces sp. NPDC059697]|uniref:YceI family protein n=1 Tax=Streptomyces sp. NPDC059697 TaxID=3346912 RepID=UPI0036A0A638